MRRLMSSMSMQTPREKRGMLDGINLFFGALLGANLGTTQGMPLRDYAELILLLAFTVMTLRIFSTSERRGYAWSLLGMYAAITPLSLYAPKPVIQGLDAATRDHLAVTMAIWVAAVIVAEIFPTRPAAKDDQAG